MLCNVVGLGDYFVNLICVEIVGEDDDEVEGEDIEED